MKGIYIAFLLLTLGCNSNNRRDGHLSTDQNITDPCPPEWDATGKELKQLQVNDTTEQLFLNDTLWFEVIGRSKYGKNQFMAYIKNYRTNGKIQEEGIAIYFDHPIADYVEYGKWKYYDCDGQLIETKMFISDAELDQNTGPSDSVVNLFSGYWLNEDFLRQVEENHSIFKSREFVGELFGFTLDKKELSSGKAELKGFTAHEGGYGVPIKWIDNFGCFTSTGQIEENSSIQTPMDVVLTKDKKIEFQFEDSRSEYYRKVNDDYTELRKILFEGNYEDSLGTSYRFDANGNLTGIGGKRYYSLLYEFGEGLYFDVIFISDNENGGNEELFHYSISGDSLRLYEIKGEAPEFEIGNLKYELYKK